MTLPEQQSPLCHHLVGCPRWRTAQRAPGSATTKDEGILFWAFPLLSHGPAGAPGSGSTRTTADKCSIPMPKRAGWRNSVLLRLGRVFFIINVPINTYFSAVYTKNGNFHNLQPCFWNGLELKCANSSLLGFKIQKSPALSLNSTPRTPKGFYSTSCREQRDTDNSLWHAQPHTFSCRNRNDRKATFQSFRTILWFN